MSILKVVLVPPFMVGHINSGALAPKDLLDVNVLRSILSDLCVAKYYQLNRSVVAQNMAIGDLLLLNNLKEYVDNAVPDVDDDLKTLCYNYRSVLDCLCEVGNEPLNKALLSQITMYALRFDVVRISNKTYGIMYKQLQEVNSVEERIDFFRQDLGVMLTLASEEVEDKHLLHEDLYQTYLSLM